MERENYRIVKTHIAAGIRAFTWEFLSLCETELRLSTVAEQVFNEHRTRTDAFLGASAPVVLHGLNAALDRAQLEQEPESRSHALLSCRRVLVEVADVVFPAQDEPWLDGQGHRRQVGVPQYRNRLAAAVERASA